MADSWSYTIKYQAELPPTTTMRIRKTDGTDFTDDEIKVFLQIAEEGWDDGAHRDHPSGL